MGTALGSTLGSTPGKNTSSALTHGPGASRRGPGEITIDADPADLAAVEDELEAKLGLDLAELATVYGMLQRGAHPRAAVNKIRKDRGGVHTAGELADSLIAGLRPGDAA